MKFAVALLFLAAAANAGVLHAPLAAIATGASQVSRSEDGLGNYAFSYNEGHATGGTFRSESGSPGAVTGSYGLRDADGRVRTVNYIADAAGYRASISSNEPGVESRSSADAIVNGAPIAVGPAPIALAPAAAYAAPALLRSAPIFAAPAVAAPVFAAPAGISYSSSVNHAAPARLLAPAFAAPLHARPAFAAPLHAAPAWAGAPAW